jgi:hypothetical protein
MQINTLFVDDLTNTTPPDLEHAIVQLAKSGVEEKFRLDFKEIWDADKQCPDVAALANSYGGLLVIGVSNDRQRFPGTVPPKNSDLKNLKTKVSCGVSRRDEDHLESPKRNCSCATSSTVGYRRWSQRCGLGKSCPEQRGVYQCCRCHSYLRYSYRRLCPRPSQALIIIASNLNYALHLTA